MKRTRFSEEQIIDVLKEAEVGRLRRKLQRVRMRDELLNETLFFSLAHTRVEITAWVEDYNRTIHDLRGTFLSWRDRQTIRLLW